MLFPVASVFSGNATVKVIDKLPLFKQGDKEKSLSGRGENRLRAGAGAAGSRAGAAVRSCSAVCWYGLCHCGAGVWLYADDSASEMDPAVNEYNC